MSHEELVLAKKLKSVINLEGIRVFSDSISDWIYMLERNINAKILMAEASFKMHEIFKQEHKEKVVSV